MQDAILIQSWFTPDYRQMIDLTRDRHAFYAKKHDMDYLPNDLTASGITTGQKCYQDIKTIKSALDKGYEFVINMDIDAIIWDLNRDLREACIDIRGVRFDAMRVKHVNIGITYIRNCEITRRFIKAWEAQAIGRQASQFGSQNGFNIVTGQMGIPPLDPTWNYCYSQHKGIDKPAVRGYHDFIGFDYKMKAMRDDLDALENGVMLQQHRNLEGLYEWRRN